MRGGAAGFLAVMCAAMPGLLHAAGEAVEVDRDEIYAILKKKGCPQATAKEYFMSLTGGMIYLDCMTKVLERLGCMEAPEGGTPSFGRGLMCLREANGLSRGGGGGQTIGDVRLMMGAYLSDGDGSAPLMGISTTGPEVRLLAADAILDPFMTSDAPLEGLAAVHNRYGLELADRQGGGFLVGRMSVGGPSFLQGKMFGTGDVMDHVILDIPGDEPQVCRDLACVERITSLDKPGEALGIGADLILQAATPRNAPWTEVPVEQRGDLLRKYVSQFVWSKIGLLVIESKDRTYAQAHAVEGRGAAAAAGIREGERILSLHEPADWQSSRDSRPLQHAEYANTGIYDAINVDISNGIVALRSGAIGERPELRRLTVHPGEIIFEAGVVALDKLRPFAAPDPGRERRYAQIDVRREAERRAQEIEAARPQEFVMFEANERNVIEMIYKGNYAAAAAYVPQREEFTPDIDSIFVDPVRRIVHTAYAGMMWKPIVKDYAIARASILGTCPGDTRPLTVVTTTSVDGQVTKRESRNVMFTPDFHRIILELDNFDVGTGLGFLEIPWLQFFGNLHCEHEVIRTLDRNMAAFYDYHP